MLAHGRDGLVCLPKCPTFQQRKKKKTPSKEVPCKYTKEEVFAPQNKKFKSLSFGPKELI